MIPEPADARVQFQEMEGSYRHDCKCEESCLPEEHVHFLQLLHLRDANEITYYSPLLQQPEALNALIDLLYKQTDMA